ncbi:MAG: UbiA family prenyltransferase [Candidatus Aenigmarchaeota archaeon]|nr:UbiA family prenyltransferase [Candidatus Aenigmarchaeota archaeon]
MKIKNIIYNSITMSIPNNVFQYFLGATLFFIIFGSVDVSKLIIGLSGFLLSYSSVYLYNDIIDYEEDKKHKEKIKWKIIARGDLSKKTAKNLILVFVALGVPLSFLVNKFFGIIAVLLILLNVLHSSPKTKFKKKKLGLINLTVIQFLKYSLGWFALTTNLSKFPLWLILCFSLTYSSIYFLYKLDFKKNLIIKNKKTFFLFGFSIASTFFISLFLYEFVLSLLMLFSLGVFSLSIIRKFQTLTEKINLKFFILPLILFSFLILTYPAASEINNNMKTHIESYEDNISSKVPPEIRSGIENLSEIQEKYKNLTEVEKEFNKTLEKIKSNLSEGE